MYNLTEYILQVQVINTVRKKVLTATNNFVPIVVTSTKHVTQTVDVPEFITTVVTDVLRSLITFTQTETNTIVVPRQATVREILPDVETEIIRRTRFVTEDRYVISTVNITSESAAGIHDVSGSIEFTNTEVIIPTITTTVSVPEYTTVTYCHQTHAAPAEVVDSVGTYAAGPDKEVSLEAGGIGFTGPALYSVVADSTVNDNENNIPVVHALPDPIISGISNEDSESSYST